MGSGATGNNKITKLDLAQITYFNQEIQRMKFANEKNGFKNKTKETNHAIDQAILKLRQDKLLDTGEMKDWNTKRKEGKKSARTNKKDGKELKKSIGKVAIDHEKVKAKPGKTEKIMTQAKSPEGSQSHKKLYMGQIGRRYLMEANKIKSENKLLQYESLNPSIHVNRRKSKAQNIPDF